MHKSECYWSREGGQRIVRGPAAVLSRGTVYVRGLQPDTPVRVGPVQGTDPYAWASPQQEEPDTEPDGDFFAHW